MTELSITRAWSEATAFLRREFGIVFLIAFLLICLPGAALQYAIPATEGPPIVTPEEFYREMQPFLLFMPAVIILATIGSVAITYLAIRPGTSVGEALAMGARRFFMVLVASLLVGFGAMLAFLPVYLVLMPNAAAAPSPLLLFLVILALALLFMAVWVKLMLITPVAAAERGGPIALITRSWALTRGWFWKLFGFQIVFWLAASVLLMVASLVIGMILALTLGSPLAPGTAAFFALNLITAGMQAVVSMAFATTVAKIYSQLTGAVDREIFA